MEIRKWAIRILSADTLEEKLLSPGKLSDHCPGKPLLWKEPVRPPGMHLHKRRKKEKLPSFQEHHQTDKRAVCLHRFAGHELLAVEIMAYCLLAFPQAPNYFRKGLVNTLQDEQRHVSLYIQRMKAMGLNFGDLPLYRHFWIHTPHMNSPLSFVSNVSLTFEMANLDFACMYGKSFLRNGDTKSADLMAEILQDEISHVSFGLHWLRKLKPKQLSDWDAWRENLSHLVSPKRAKGFVLHESYRRLAGIPEDWINKLKEF